MASSMERAAFRFAKLHGLGPCSVQEACDALSEARRQFGQEIGDLTAWLGAAPRSRKSLYTTYVECLGALRRAGLDTSAWCLAVDSEAERRGFAADVYLIASVHSMDARGGLGEDGESYAGAPRVWRGKRDCQQV